MKFKHYFPMAVILLLALGLYFLPITKHYHDFSGYHQEDKYSIKQDFSQLDKAFGSKKDVYLVVYKTGCKDCLNVEDKLVPQIKKLKEENKTVVVMDVAKMNREDKMNFGGKFFDLLNNGKLSTPTVAHLKPNDNRWKIMKSSNSVNSKELINALGGD